MNTAYTSLHRHEGTHKHSHALTQTFAALRPVVGVPSWTIAAFHGSRRVDACAFVVTAAVVFCALVEV